MDALLDCIRRHTDLQAPGSVETAIPGLILVCATTPSELKHSLERPVVCLVRQGAKRVASGTRELVFATGDSLVVTADVPATSRIVRASAAEPYYAVAVLLDPALIADLGAEMGTPPETALPRLEVARTEPEVADAVLRLLQLLDQPDARPVLQAERMRELHYWLLAGRHGPAIRQLGWPGGPVQRIARAVGLLRREFATPLPVARLADEAGMSASAFHRHFRNVTSLTPLQFQKQLRLLEARRLLRSQGATASRAAYAVGYESVPQFTREYGRMFGRPPATDARTAMTELDT